MKLTCVAVLFCLVLVVNSQAIPPFGPFGVPGLPFIPPFVPPVLYIPPLRPLFGARQSILFSVGSGFFGKRDTEKIETQAEIEGNKKIDDQRDINSQMDKVENEKANGERGVEKIEKIEKVEKVEIEKANGERGVEKVEKANGERGVDKVEKVEKIEMTIDKINQRALDGFRKITDIKLQGSGSNI